MEQDRFVHHKKLFVVGMVCMLLSLVLIFFSLYIVPFLLWNLNYDVPYFVEAITAYINYMGSFSDAVSKFFTWLLFCVPGLLFGVASYHISNYIDNELLGIRDKEEIEDTHALAAKSNQSRDALILTSKIIFMMLFIVVLIYLLQQFFTVSA